MRATDSTTAHATLAAHPTIAIVIVTYNRRESLADTLRSITVSCTTPPNELVVVDQGPEYDHSVIIGPLAARGIRCSYVYSCYRCLAAARNIGISHVNTDVVLFLDDDIEILTDIVSAHAARYACEPAIVATAGHVVVEPFSERFVRLNTTTPSGAYVRGGRGCHMSFSRKTLESIGGFNSFITQSGDESEVFALIAKRGLLVGNCPAAVVKHLVKPGGTRSVTADSFPWYMIYFRDNLARVGRLHGVLAAVAWPWLNFRRMVTIIRSGIAAGTPWDVVRSYWLGLQFARIAHASHDHIALSVAFSACTSGIKTPVDAANNRGRQNAIRVSRQVNDATKPNSQKFWNEAV